MRLHHFTTERNALLIGLGNGLKPGIHKANTPDTCAFQTMGVPVVWLTKEESNVVTAEHVAHFQKLGVNHDQKIGDLTYGGPVQCVVEIERSRHVMRWSEFLRTTPIEGVGANGERITGRDVLGAFDMMPNMRVAWWVSLKAIPTSKIWVPMTREQAMAGAAEHASDHPDAEGREQWARQRDTFAAQEPGALILLHDGRCQLLGKAKAA